MDSRLIQFHAVEKDFLPAPYPANKAIPDWFKNMSQEAPLPEGNPIQTLKQCPPFLDALSGGYILPLSGDIQFKMDDDGKLTVETPGFQAGLATHPPAQVMGSPWEKMNIVKFLNPWVIVTPAGYSTLFVQPLNREPIPFTIFAGIVDTDGFYREVNFPSACNMARGTTCTLKRGTPLVQAIPFKRDEWQSQIVAADPKRLADMQRQVSTTKNSYRDWFHEKKTFG